MAAVVPHSATLCTVAHQASLSMGFSRLEYWSGLPFPSPGNLPDPGIGPGSSTSPALAGRFFTTSTTWVADSLESTTKTGFKCFVKGAKEGIHL